jgi:hypothetical protein
MPQGEHPFDLLEQRLADPLRVAAALGHRDEVALQGQGGSVVNGGPSPAEATALLLETAWAIVLSEPAPSYEDG